MCTGTPAVVTGNAHLLQGGADHGVVDGRQLMLMRRIFQLMWGPGQHVDGEVLAEELHASAFTVQYLQAAHAAGKLTAAICAAPTVLAKAGLLDGRRAVCYPGMEDQLTGRCGGDGPVEVDGTVITSRGVGTAIPFALAIVEYFAGAQKAHELAHAIVFR